MCSFPLDLVTNNPDKARQLRDLGPTVADTIPAGVFATGSDIRYLQAKAAHTGHTIALAAVTEAA
ncbi:GTP cyclohydrolase II [Glycomyces tarimensis]